MRKNLIVAASFYYFTEVRFAGRNYRAQKLEARLKDWVSLILYGKRLRPLDGAAFYNLKAALAFNELVS